MVNVIEINISFIFHKKKRLKIKKQLAKRTSPEIITIYTQDKDGSNTWVNLFNNCQ